MRTPIIIALLLVASCSDLPQDPEGTLERVRAEQRFRVGLVARAGPTTGPERRFIEQVGRAARASAQIEHAASERLLSRLEAGELDLVVGEFHATSPWVNRVTFVPPLAAGSDRSELIVSAAARNGENAWIGLLHGQAAQLESGR